MRKESEAGAAQRRRSGSHPRVPGDDREHAGAGRRDERHRARGAVHVVEQVEGVDDRDDPDGRDGGIHARPRPELPPQSGRRDQRPDDELDRDPHARREGAPVVDRPDDRQDRDPSEQRERAARIAGADQDRERKRRHDRGAAEVRRRLPMALVAGRDVVEGEPASGGDRQRRRE